MALVHGWVCYYFPILGFQGVLLSDGQTATNWQISSISFTFLLHVATYKLLLESYFWNTITALAGVASLLLYWLIVVVGSLPSISNIF